MLCGVPAYLLDLRLCCCSCWWWCCHLHYASSFLTHTHTSAHRVIYCCMAAAAAWPIVCCSALLSHQTSCTAGMCLALVRMGDISPQHPLHMAPPGCHGTASCGMCVHCIIGSLQKRVGVVVADWRWHVSFTPLLTSPDTPTHMYFCCWHVLTVARHRPCMAWHGIAWHAADRQAGRQAVQHRSRDCAVCAPPPGAFDCFASGPCCQVSLKPPLGMVCVARAAQFIMQFFGC